MLDREAVCGMMLKPEATVAREAISAIESFIILLLNCVVQIIVLRGVSPMKLDSRGWNGRVTLFFRISSHRSKTIDDRGIRKHALFCLTSAG